MFITCISLSKYELVDNHDISPNYAGSEFTVKSKKRNETWNP